MTAIVLCLPVVFKVSVTGMSTNERCNLEEVTLSVSSFYFFYVAAAMRPSMASAAAFPHKTV